MAEESDLVVEALGEAVGEAFFEVGEDSLEMLADGLAEFDEGFEATT